MRSRAIILTLAAIIFSVMFYQTICMIYLTAELEAQRGESRAYSQLAVALTEDLLTSLGDALLYDLSCYLQRRLAGASLRLTDLHLLAEDISSFISVTFESRRRNVLTILNQYLPGASARLLLNYDLQWRGNILALHALLGVEVTLGTARLAKERVLDVELLDASGLFACVTRASEILETYVRSLNGTLLRGSIYEVLCGIRDELEIINPQANFDLRISLTPVRKLGNLTLAVLSIKLCSIRVPIRIMHYHWAEARASWLEVKVKAELGKQASALVLVDTR